jgi:hypothetical protein
MAGIYETYDGTVVTLLDDRAPACTNTAHVAGHDVPEFAGIAPDSEVTLHADRQRKP